MAFILLLTKVNVCEYCTWSQSLLPFIGENGQMPLSKKNLAFFPLSQIN